MKALPKQHIKELWTDDLVSKSACQSAHEVHSHDKMKLMKIKGKETRSGVFRPGSTFLDAMGFDLGDLDRDGRAVSVPWRRVNVDRQFRSSENFAVKRDHRKWLSAAVNAAGRPFGSLSVWSAFGHAVPREAAKMNLSVMNFHDRQSVWPIEGSELTPAAVYSRKFQRQGERALRDHLSPLRLDVRGNIV